MPIHLGAQRLLSVPVVPASVTCVSDDGDDDLELILPLRAFSCAEWDGWWTNLAFCSVQ